MNVLTRGQNLDVSSTYINDQHVHIFALWIDSVAYVVGIVPQADRRLSQGVFVAEYTYACCVQREKSPGGGFESKPTGREYSQKMPARPNQYIAFDRAHAANNMFGPNANLLRQFSIRTAVAE